MSNAKCVIWDFDGTLAHRPEMWSGAVLSAIRAVGITCDAVPQDVRPFLQKGFPWHQPEVVRPAGREPNEWWAALDAVFVPAIRALSGVDRDIATAVARRVRDVYTDPTTWAVYEDTHATLEAFSQAGWKQVVLSNHVPELRSLARALGLSRYLAKIFNSADTGIEKPHPEAYRQVLETLPNGSSVWMIGDSIHADVCGPESVGINAVLVRSRHPDAKRSCATLGDAFAMLTGT
jgi:putative hydrolase of the HAD superfamily